MTQIMAITVHEFVLHKPSNVYKSRTDLNGKDILRSMLRYLDLCMPEYLLR
jgi:hypothetical protein